MLEPSLNLILEKESKSHSFKSYSVLKISECNDVTLILSHFWTLFIVL
jgi:hypothetical protein